MWRKPAKTPEGARILHGDGRVTECILVPDTDPAGWWIRLMYTRWLVIPPDGVLFDPDAGDAVKIDGPPPRRTLLYLGLDHVRLPARWGGQEPAENESSATAA